jgi:hypothetical protein
MIAFVCFFSQWLVRFGIVMPSAQRAAARSDDP